MEVKRRYMAAADMPAKKGDIIFRVVCLSGENFNDIATHLQKYLSAMGTVAV
jgi:hypothetical protein